MKRVAILGFGVLALGALALPALVRPAPRLVWNASASVPIGLYAARPAQRLKTGELVAAMPPEPLARFMSARGYLPPDTPMLKHVAALGGQRICRIGRTILVDGIRVATALARDTHGRAMPVWHGCRTLAPDEALLLNASAKSSFDGRYFGAVSTRSIRAILTPLWLVAAPDARVQPASQTTTNGDDHDQNR